MLKMTYSSNTLARIWADIASEVGRERPSTQQSLNDNLRYAWEIQHGEKKGNEIAASLGIKPSAFYVRLQRAKQRLIALYKRRESLGLSGHYTSDQVTEFIDQYLTGSTKPFK